MILGISSFHDSGIAISDNQGRVLLAVAEERFTRKKSDAVFPRNSLVWAGEQIDLSAINTVVVSGFSRKNHASRAMTQWYFRDKDFVAFDGQRDYRFPFGFSESDPFDEQEFRIELTKSLEPFGINAPIVFVEHHASHAFSAIVTSGYEEGVFLTLDGEGDGSSGTIGNFKRESGYVVVNHLRRFPIKNSLGYFYSAVTRRYNFKPFSHEGKITGLAAYGNLGDSYVYLKKYIKVKNGLPLVRTPGSKFVRFLKMGIRLSGLFPNSISSMQDIVDSASLLCREYPELAASAQVVLEDTVLGILAHESVSGKKPDLVLAGGVFSNVRLNEKVASSTCINRCFIYPNMGDGGLSVGGIYKYLSNTKELHPSEFQHFDPYIGPKIEIEDLKEHKKLVSRHFSSFELWVEQIVSNLKAGAVIGLIQGHAEFGPRALMNRSIIATPSDKSLNQSLNSRLKRTEFMPFAPVVRVENFSNVFCVDKFKDFTPFMFMTMTCSVRSEWLDKLAAVVHVDGTARPQVVTFQSNPVAWEILKIYEERTGIPCLINTSFNVHEEPIVNSAQHVFEALESNMVDLVATPHLLLFKNN